MKKNNNNKKPLTLDEIVRESERLAEESRKMVEEAEKKIEAFEKLYPVKPQQPPQRTSFDALDARRYHVVCYANPGLFLSLSKARIKKIPKRHISWFTGMITTSLYAYSLDGKEMVQISSVWTNQNDVLYHMQDKGYRFIKANNESYLEVAKDCSTCRYARKCPVAIQAGKFCPAQDTTSTGNILLSFSSTDWQTLTTVNDLS